METRNGQLGIKTLGLAQGWRLHRPSDLFWPQLSVQQLQGSLHKTGLAVDAALSLGLVSLTGLLDGS